MSVAFEITPALETRLKRVAERSNRPVGAVVADALEYGRSLEWQEHVLEKVERGIAAAAAGDFATDEEIAELLGRYGPDAAS